MSEREVTIHIKISRRTFVWAAAALLMCCSANEVVSESLTLTTYYPAPSGVYLRMTTTGPGNTILTRDSGNVGIGTTSPGAKLEVNGNVRINDGTQAAGSVLTSDQNGFASWQPPASVVFPDYSNGISQSPGIIYQAPSNGYLSVVAWGPWMNSLTIKVGATPSLVQTLVGLMGDDINNNTKGGSALIPMKKNTYYIVTNSDPNFFFGYPFEHVIITFYPAD
jgi:hypothetical protein